jgi:hypothetical protein
VCALCSGGDYFALPNKRYANVGDHLHRHRAKQLYVELPLELTDRSQGSDMACSLKNR